MRLLTFISTFSTFLATTSAQACNADNCARAVSGTRFGAAFISTARADCSSFQRVTVTPKTVTSTTTSSVATSSATTSITQTVTTLTTSIVIGTSTQTVTTVIEYTFPANTRKARDVLDEDRIPSPSSADITDIARRQMTAVPSSVPAYASPCAGTVRYQSACSCLGITRTTVTVATPTVWVSVVGSTSTTVTIQETVTTTSVGTTFTTATIAATATAMPSACLASNNFGFNYVGGYTNAGPGQGYLGATYPNFPSIKDQQGCCQKCFETPNCFIYYLNEGCSLYVFDAASVDSGTNICPAGVALEYTSPGDLFGLGPCVTYAGYGQ